MKTFKFLTLICIAFFTLLTSCKKDKKQPNCKIITVNMGAQNFVINYDEQNRIASVVSGSTTRTYVYTGSTITITETNGGSFSKRRIVTVGANNMPVNLREEQNTAGTLWMNSAFEYNGTELSRLTQTGSGGTAPMVVTYTWANGNPVSASSGSTTNVIAVDASKPAQAGDFSWFSAFYHEWITVLKPKNLITSIAGSTFTYTFDSDNKISSLISGGTTVSYNYTCN